MERIGELLRGLAAGVLRAANLVFGRFEWHPPAWLSAAGKAIASAWRFLTADRRRLAILALLLAAATAGTWWYKTRPRPHYVDYQITSPGLTTYDDNGIATIKPFKIVFTESAAPLRQVEKRITSGVELSPALAGNWFWVNDKELQFTPRNDWPVDGDFNVRFARKGLLAAGVELENYKFEFRSQPFSAKVSESQFYQDPRDPNLKQLVATFQFSHPVDVQQFEQRVSLTVPKDAEYLGLKPDTRHFTVSYDKFKLAATVHSGALQMPRDDTPMTVYIDKGVRAARGGNETKDVLKTVVTIPGRTSLRFSGAQMTLVDNARYEPEQILLVTSSSPVTERALAGKVAACVLPVRSPRQTDRDKGPYQWDNPGEVGQDTFPKCQSLPLAYVASETGTDTSHGFKFKAPVGRFIYVAIRDGIEGTGGYISGKPYIATVKVEPYPQKLSFLGQGALLSLAGDKKVGFLARDVDRVEVEIGRVLPSQVQHLAPNMWDYAHPNVGDYIENTIVERFTAVRDYSGKAPGKPTYDSIDLGEYLQGRTQANRGLFLLHIRVAPPKSADAGDQAGGDGGSEDGVGEGEGEGSVEPASRFGQRQDTRLILITDLGFIVKLEKDGSRDVFVQSIHNGTPVEGARIEVLGVNGQPVAAATTDTSGKATLPKLGVLRREKTPLMIVAQKDADFSFMPLQTQGRGLDMSRFDTGGVENAKSAQQLATYLFTDRGIYRPGETTHLGVITRTADWQSSLAGLPLEVEITDPRGAVVSRDAVKLSPLAFDEVAYTSQAASPTGTYQAAAYLVKDPKKRELLGSTSFKVQEFEPDRMKVRLDLSDQAIEGWLRPDDVKARVSVAHLFGDPASGRRVTGELSLTAVLPRFARYPDYRFQTAEFLMEPFHEDLTAVVTDDKGIAEFKLDLNRFAGRAYRLNLLARAFEAEGGRNVAAQNSAIVSEAPFLVGVKPDGDMSFVQRNSARQARWLAVNQQLVSVAEEGLTLDWVQRKYVSVLTQQPNQTYRYVSRLKEIVRNSRKVRIAAGGSNIPLPTQEPGDFVLVLRDSAGAELNKLSYSVAGEANLSGSLERNAELQVQLDKASYRAGDTISVSIRAPYAGSGLITIERDKVFQQQWFKATTTSTVQKIQLPRDFEGNGYVSVQYVRDPSSEEIFLSPLSYGVAAFSADLAARTQTLTLTAPREIKPGSTLIMRVAPGEASRVAVLAVDEGILQVARYKNPEPLGYFFQKRMLEVDTTQILDLILPEFKRFLALAAPGGDEDGGFARHLNPFNKKRKPPVAWWSGVIDVGPGGKELRYTVPDYFNGKLRIVAIAANARKVGVAENDTEVKGSFILTPNVPNSVTPGDDFSVSVGVFNNLEGQGPIHVEVQQGGELAAEGPVALDLDIASKKEASAEFRFKANPRLGAASLKFVARRGNAESHIEESVGIRPAVAYRTQLSLGSFEGSSVSVPLARDLYPERRKVEASVSSMPLVWGQSLIAWLDDYPYSCTEQQVSKGVAALLVASHPEFGVIRTNDSQPLTSVFSTLQARQNDQGGLGLWASSPETAEFPTIYAVHFLLEAKERGQKIPAATLAGANDWLLRFATTPAPTIEAARLRAYAVYLMARQGIKPGAALVNVEQELTHRYEKTWQSDLAAAYLASTYRLMQRNDDADKAFGKITWSQQKKDWTEETYYDPGIHDSQLLYLIARHFPNRLAATPPAVLQGIGNAVSGTRMSSLSAAYALLALDAYTKTAGATSKFGVTAIDKTGLERAMQLPANSMPKAAVPEGTTKIRFGKDGKLTGYYALNESGFDRNVPGADVTQGIEIIHEFLDLKGTPVTQVKVGDEFLVRLRLRATKRDRVSQVAVVDLFPGSVESVLEIRPPADSSTPGSDPARLDPSGRQAAGFGALPIGLPDKSNWLPQHIDVRDDRLVLYGTITKDASTFVYRVRATNAGVFQAPPAFAEGLYDRKVSGMGVAGKIEIVKP
jgi:alpha-2-macroglobulin